MVQLQLVCHRMRDSQSNSGWLAFASGLGCLLCAAFANCNLQAGDCGTWFELLIQGALEGVAVVTVWF
jgi:hypothetical protein